MAFLFPLLHKSSNSFFGHNYSLLGLYPFMIFYYLQSMHNCKKWGKVPITISIHYLLVNYTILYLEYPGNDKKGHSKPTFSCSIQGRLFPFAIFAPSKCVLFEALLNALNILKQDYINSLPVWTPGHQEQFLLLTGLCGPLALVSVLKVI